MNIKDYIESGIVAAYVMGLATEAEQKEFESLCKQYPELVEAKRSFELSLEDQLMKEAVPVPEGLKEKILGSLNVGLEDKRPQPIRDFKRSVREMNAWKMMAAACILLLSGSIYFAYSFREKYRTLQKENAQLKQSLENSSDTNPLLAADPIVKNPSVNWAFSFCNVRYFSLKE